MRWMLFMALICFTVIGFSQVKGIITDPENNPLSFTSVYLKGTSKGTSSNLDGHYEIYPSIGPQILVIQYLGYQTVEKAFLYEGNALEINIMLHPSVYVLEELTVSSNQEDPAYSIIREAMEKRKFHLSQQPGYTCDAYTKGYIRILDAPQKILGKELGTLDGNLDTNRKGFVYLSETVSKLKFQKPDHFQEEMISSIISGRDNGFSYNSASSIRFNFYENSNDFGKSIVSPIADMAFSYYRYRLIGVDTSADHQNVYYRIQLIPLQKNLACWNGEISIKDGEWSVQSVNVYVTGKQIHQEIFDTVSLRQVFIPVGPAHLDKIQNQIFTFKANFLGIKLEGKFAVVFSNYILDDNIKIENLNTLVNVLAGANEKSKMYWDSVRPIPLTVDEQNDYVLKDSIKIIRASKTYKDSVDAKNNKFKLTDLFFGYTYTNSFNHWNLSIGSPLELFHFNPVQGWALGSTLKYNQWFGDFSNRKKISAEFKLDYGFSENKFRPQIGITYRFNRKKEASIGLNAGITLREFDSQESSVILNEINNLYLKRSYLKFFEMKFVELQFDKNLTTDLTLSAKIGYSNRTQLENHSNFSFRKKSELYQPNSKADHIEDSLNIRYKQHIQLQTHVSWLPFTKLWITPREIIKLESQYPLFEFQYFAGMYPESQLAYHKLSLGISKEFRLGHWGRLKLNGLVSRIISKYEVDIPEFIYPKGNRLSVYFSSAQNDKFLALNPYAFSSATKSLSLFIEHDFQGLLLDRIPFINKLGFKEIVRYSVLATPATGPYSELSIGIGNIGYKMFRLFQMDVVHQYVKGKFQASYLRIGIIKSFSAGDN
jgi:hypothetical protein